MTRKDSLSPASRSRLAPRLVTAVVLAVLAVVFLIQNNQLVTIRILIPVVTMPLWVALGGMLLVGVAIGYALSWRRGDTGS
jgi:uncharacterized integral membrane protein